MKTIDSILSAGDSRDITSMVESLNQRYGVNEASKILANMMSEDTEVTDNTGNEGDDEKNDPEVSAPQQNNNQNQQQNGGQQQGQQMKPITDDILNGWTNLSQEIEKFVQSVKGTPAEQYINKIFNLKAMQQFKTGLQDARNQKSDQQNNGQPQNQAVQLH